MGGACFKGGPTLEEPLHASSPTGSGPSSASLASVLKAAGRPRSLSAAQLDGILGALGGSPEQVAREIDPWLSKASAKQRAGLEELLHRAVARAMDEGVAAAEAIAKNRRDTSEDFNNLASRCEDALTIDRDVGRGVQAAGRILCSIARRATGSARQADSHVCQSFDRVVAIFRRALVALVGSQSTSLAAWREFMERTRLPALDEHLCLLSTQSRAALLGTVLAEEGAQPLAMVIRRGAALADAIDQLPDQNGVLCPYFASSAGTKVIKGQRVEGGEGHGPRKEFFIASSADMLERWGPPETSPPEGSLLEPAPVWLDGRLLRRREEAGAGSHGTEEVWALLSRAKAGQRLGIEFASGVEETRVVVQPWRDGAISVDPPFERANASEDGRSEDGIRKLTLQAPAHPLFEFHRHTGQQWFSAYANELGINLPTQARPGQDLRGRYCSFGKLLALAIVNHCKISFTLPLLFFNLLLNRDLDPTLEDLRSFDPALHDSFRKVLKMKDGQFKDLKEVEDVDRDMTRDFYVSKKVRETLAPEAMQEIRKGFWQLVGTRSLEDVSPQELQRMLCPAEVKRNLNIRETFRVKVEEEMQENDVFMKAFWAVIGSLTSDEKRRFLIFVTGVETPPEAGTEELSIMLPFSAFSQDEHVAMLQMLPQAHTCTNTLELPNYYEALIGSGKFEEGQGGLETELRRLLGEKLRLAISEGGGYELDAAFGDECNENRPIASQPVREPIALVPRFDTYASPGEASPSGPTLRAAAPVEAAVAAAVVTPAVSAMAAPQAPVVTPKVDVDTFLEDLDQELGLRQDSEKASGGNSQVGSLPVLTVNNSEDEFEETLETLYTIA